MFLDINMDGADGLETAGEVKEWVWIFSAKGLWFAVLFILRRLWKGGGQYESSRGERSLKPEIPCRKGAGDIHVIQGGRYERHEAG